MIGFFITSNLKEDFILVGSRLFVRAELIGYTPNSLAAVLKNVVVSVAILVRASWAGLCAGANGKLGGYIFAFITKSVPSVRKNAIYPRSNRLAVALVEALRKIYGIRISASTSEVLSKAAALSAESYSFLNVGVVVIVIVRLNVSANRTGSVYGNTAATVGSAIHKGCAYAFSVTYRGCSVINSSYRSRTNVYDYRVVGIKLTVLYVLNRVIGILICHAAIVAPVSLGCLNNAIYFLVIAVMMVVTSVEVSSNGCILSARTLRKLNVGIASASAQFGKIIFLYYVGSMSRTVSVVRIVAVETIVSCGIAVLAALTVKGEAYLILMSRAVRINVGIIVNYYAFAILYAIGIVVNVLGVLPNRIRITSDFKTAILAGGVTNLV